MKIEEIKQKVDQVVYDVLKESHSRDEITPDKHLIIDLNASSAEVLEIFLTLMTEFSVEMERKGVMNLKNLNDVYLYIELLLNAKEKELVQV
jgi:acyl carrier protein